ncbi:hypothetical protein ABGB16_29990 [Micromonospora sp. B11E3]|uniref:hypothetical protein n=1 Tax=Micromonospora sp. B11E3 TaxID=3153562 RepID=UPI00325F84B8
MTTIAERALALWTVPRQAPPPDPVHAALQAVARRTQDPTNTRQRRDLHQALDCLAAAQGRHGLDHCHTIAAVLAVASLLASLPDRWLADVYYRSAAQRVHHNPPDQHLWDELDVITVYDTLADHRRAHHTAEQSVRLLIVHRGYLAPIAIAGCLTWAHLHPHTGQLPTAGGVAAVAARGLRHVSHPMLRAALTGLAATATGARPCHIERTPLAGLANPQAWPVNTKAAS